ncbi:MAG TPA: sulfite exporter TauE/SafE family protein [Xanthobacteraceae bacterium]|nr:sulfite exporter TauE/SafE family protein [Xanthobacteraceae bacterium]
MTLFEIALLSVAGFGAGVLNAVAGGGTFLTFAALVAVGLPTIEANATSAVALNPANFASVLGYRKEIRTYFRDMVTYSIFGLLGGALGALLLIWIGDAGFRPTVPWLLLLATLLFAYSDRIRALAAPWAEGEGRGAARVAGLIMFIVAVYGGFFAAGMGIMMLAALIITEKGDYHKANAIKMVASALIQLMSSATLIIGGLVHWPAAIVTMIASTIGGYLGVDIARRVPAKIIRAVVITTGAVLTVVFFFRT